MEELRCDLTKVCSREQKWQVGCQVVVGVVRGAAAAGGLVHAIGLVSNGRRKNKIRAKMTFSHFMFLRPEKINKIFVVVFYNK
jgi:hypothetical protein